MATTSLQRARPTLTSADLNRRPNGSRLGMTGPVATGAPIEGGAVSTTTAAPQRTTYAAFQAKQAPRPLATPATRAMAPDTTGMTDIGRQNAMVNANIYQPGTVGATNAVANGTGRPYQPPQQTERANPLTGDNNIPPEGATTSLARVPFVQRGASLPQGQDALPSAVKDTLTEDSDIGSSMAGTQARIAGQPSPFARRFASPSKQDSYNSYLRRVQGS